MKNNTSKLLLISFVIIGNLANGQSEISYPGATEYNFEKNDKDHPCISISEYQSMEERCNFNVLSLGLMSESRQMSILLDWPLANAAGNTDCENHIITNYVDQNTGAGTQDYNCGTRTYDGHRGTDLTIWPFTYYKAINGLVDVVAAADGIIVDKVNGNTDMNCVTNPPAGGGNYVIVQHSDGSRALYYHMKNNSLTSKAIGQNVITGEYLGKVASSGSSNIPHLHFEIWNTSTFGSYLDPFSGNCNSLSATSLWIDQKPYLDPAILKTGIHSVAPVFTACPTAETTNELYTYPTGTIETYFYIYKRDESIGDVVNLKIRNPDNSVFTSWTSSGTTSWNSIARSWLKALPTVPGIYTFEAELNGNICSTTFEITGSVNSIDKNPMNNFVVYPNPSEGIIYFDLGTTEVNNFSYEIYNNLGEIVVYNPNYKSNTEIQLNLKNGLYHFLIYSENSIIHSGKIVKH